MREENNPARNEEEDETDLYIRHGIRNWEEDGKGRGKQSQAASHCLCTVPLPGGRALLKTFAKQAFVLFLLPAAPSLPLPSSVSVCAAPALSRMRHHNFATSFHLCHSLSHLAPSSPPSPSRSRAFVAMCVQVEAGRQRERERERHQDMYPIPKC